MFETILKNIDWPVSQYHSSNLKPGEYGLMLKVNIQLRYYPELTDKW